MRNLVVSLFLSAILADPALALITVDAYQNMESGSAGQILTNQPQASGHGIGGTWYVVGNTMKVSSDHTIPLTGAVIVDGTTYNDTNDIRSWMTDDDTQEQYVYFQASIPHEMGTVGLYLSVGENADNPSNSNEPVLTNVEDDIGIGQIYDVVIIGFGPKTNISRYAICQIYDAPGGPYLEIEARPGNVTSHSFPIQIKANTTYWVTLKYDGAAGVASLAVFNPTNWTRLGYTTLPQLTNTFDWISFGREDHHYNGPATHSYFDNILIDYTTAVFPLFSGTNWTVPLNIARSANGSMELTITNQVGGTYEIEATTNLTDWTAIYTNLVASTTATNTFSFTDTNTTGLGIRFYRALLQ
jgi:hypothetical protein